MVIRDDAMTLQQFDEWLMRPENHERRLELLDGIIVEKAMPTREHGILAGLMVTEFNLYLRQHRIGRAAVEARHAPIDDPSNVRIPDVSVVLGMHKPIERDGTALYMPDICVEIKSPSDTYNDMREKARFYLAHGAKLVLLVYPEKRMVEHCTTQDFVMLTVDDVIESGELLPNFRLAVRDIFEGV
jgi:Uma2 family endonuclease